MTRKELAQRINSFEKELRKREWSLSGIYILGLIGGSVVLADPTRDSDLLLVVLLIWIVIPIFIVTKMNKKRRNELGLNCPNCEVNLVNEVGRLAVATLYCSQCGTKILHEQGE